LAARIMSAEIPLTSGLKAATYVWIGAGNGRQQQDRFVAGIGIPFPSVGQVMWVLLVTSYPVPESPCQPFKKTDFIQIEGDLCEAGSRGICFRDVIMS
jgi:hypothetical protein